MLYLTNEAEIREVILELSELDILWLDTEVADYKTKNPRLSLIQILAHPESLDGSRTYLLDVLDQPELTEFFINIIMKNPTITKVFHNADYDLRFLGKQEAQQVICTLELAQKIPYNLLPVSSYSLKSLTEYLTNFPQVDKKQQESDWGKRPLSLQQLKYAQMDCVYLREVYYKLTELAQKIAPDPLTENLELLAERYKEVERQWRLLDSELNQLKERLKKAMLSQNKHQVRGIKLSQSESKTVKTSLQELVKLINKKGIELDLMVPLTKTIQEQLGNNLEEIQLEIETKQITRLVSKELHES